MYWSNATKPALLVNCHAQTSRVSGQHHVRIPAFAELPMMLVVQPAYHSLPNLGQGSFFPSANLRLSCVRVLATTRRLDSAKIGKGVQHEHSKGYVIARR